MKKILVVLVLALGIAGVVGCGGTTTSAPPKTSGK